ncbi:hypothetical protein M0208_03660 [Sphingomonas sp. SUN019]|uniref:PAS domain-containing protein n=1 Tax=Sphingomonas sp. SUN019 TaxID=2937788 RepID=UPI002164DB77|nr:hypothetical protein [Sphingomonas sp. SUN019]UVO49649.1 hypothetical protein M0208_03660 [Sphingomonas sp. SUN019]
MDTARGLDQARHDADNDPTEGGVGEATIEIGGDERRMHVRAYNHWVSLLKGRAYPSIEDLDPASIADFGPHSVLLDFSRGIEDPAIQYLGRALREECSLDHSIAHISQVPARSLLSRLTDHYLQIIANRAPIGFEAEFVASRGNNTMYRGILMPFSSDADSIDYIYGVINWKELVAPAEQAKLDAELAAAVRTAPRASETPAVWADGPSAGVAEDAPSEVEETTEAIPESLADRLAIARETAAVARAHDTRSRAALYRALGRAHDFALTAAEDAEGLAELLDDAGISAQARAPMTPVVKLVFGADYDKTRVTEFAAVLTHAARVGVLTGELVEFIDGFPGGIKGVVAAARAERRPVVRTPAPRCDRAAIASVTVPTSAATGEFVLLVARAAADGSLDVLGAVENDAKLTARAVAALG